MLSYWIDMFKSCIPPKTKLLGLKLGLPRGSVTDVPLAKAIILPEIGDGIPNTLPASLTPCLINPSDEANLSNPFLACSLLLGTPAEYISTPKIFIGFLSSKPRSLKASPYVPIFMSKIF